MIFREFLDKCSSSMVLEIHDYCEHYPPDTLTETVQLLKKKRYVGFYNERVAEISMGYGYLNVFLTSDGKMKG